MIRRIPGLSARNCDDFLLILVLIRAIAEVEGKDKTAISIEKLDQLSRVVDEDFKEHGTFPEGILIGNPYRLVPLEQRDPPFTDKVQIAAKRKGFNLLTTNELFNAVVKILENPNDEEYKKQCRKRIFEVKDNKIAFD